MADDSPTPSVEVATVLRPASTAVMAPGQFDSTWRMAKALTQSGSFKDIGRAGPMSKEVLELEASKALARIMLGADLGMSPTQALMGIDIVKGNPQIRGVALGRMVRSSAKRPTPTGESYDYAVLDRGFEEGEEFAVVALYRRNDRGKWPKVKAEEGELFSTSAGLIVVSKGRRLPEAVEAFKLDQAKKRDLVKGDGAWRTQPEVMCVWRALSQLVRFYAPDVIGGMSVYTEADGLRKVEAAGSSPDPEWQGWAGVPEDRARMLEALVQRATDVGHAGYRDRHTILMRVSGMAQDAFSAWLAEAFGDVEALAAKTVDSEPEGSPVERGGREVLTFGGDTFEFEESRIGVFDVIRTALESDDPEAAQAIADRFALEAQDIDPDDPWGDALEAMAAALTRVADTLRGQTQMDVG